VPKESVGRIPTLDGLRAVSISLVLLAHLSLTPRPDVLGEAGVRTFFVISGFLITTLLLRELQTHGKISLRDFYVRRVFRIFPAFYTYIAVMIVLALADVIVVSVADFAFAMTYTMNFHEHRAWWIGHMWSLAVEEQFYLLWPLTLVVLGTRRALRVAVVAIVLAPVLRVGALRFFPQLAGLTDQAFPFVFDSIGIGCVLALARGELEASRWYRKLLDARWFWLVPLAAFATLYTTHAVIDAGISTTAANIATALAIHRCVTRPDGPLGRVLELPVMVWLGTLSYSLYLWQQPFLNRHATGWWCSPPANLGLAGLCAIASYLVIEKPALRLGRRFRR
jgi:peptidoglycan/LPS O-acetylase OafA/YrhL